VGGGRALPTGFGWADEIETVWSILRWPLGIAIVLVAAAFLYRAAPMRRIGSSREILVGALVAVVLWIAFTGLLSLYFSIQTSSAYGPLLAIVALLLWSMLTSAALHLGMATTCELAGAPRPGRAEASERPQAPGVIRVPDVERTEPSGRPR
jgi:uncharacterized BrkB/YihY/UPF0761 family membrane protein